jgi:hypothetical protein
MEITPLGARKKNQPTGTVATATATAEDTNGGGDDNDDDDDDDDDEDKEKNDSESIASRGRRIVSVACGESHALCIDRRGRLYSWGSNAEGQLGNGTTKDSPRPRPVRLLQAGGAGGSGGSGGSGGAIDLGYDDADDQVRRRRRRRRRRKTSGS